MKNYTVCTIGCLLFVVSCNLFDSESNDQDQEEEEPVAHTQNLTVSDGINSLELVFGMEAEATEGYDSGLDQEGPPAPPDDSFHGHFVISGYNLFTDYRPVTGQKTVWELSFAPENGGSINLAWSIEAAAYFGTLTLADDPDNPTVEIDMADTDSYQPGNSLQTMYIIQNN